MKDALVFITTKRGIMTITYKQCFIQVTKEWEYWVRDEQNNFLAVTNNLDAAQEVIDQHLQEMREVWGDEDM